MDGGMYYGSSGKRPHLDDDGGDRGNGRYKKRSNLNEDQLASALPQDTEYRLLCPGSKIGSLIGKGGSVIKALRTECKSKIKVEDPVAGSDERVVLISSSSDQLKEGSSYASSDSWSDQLKGGSYVCNAQEAVFKVHARINEVEEEEEPVSVRLLVPKSHIGCLLGKGGKIIEQMRKDFGAQIRILPKEQHPPCAAPADELVQVTGEASVVKKALFAITTRLHDNVSGERTQKAPAASNFIPPIPGSSLYPSGGYLQPAGPLLGPSLGGPMASLGYSYGGLYGDTGMGGAWPLPSALSMPPQLGNASGHGGEEEELTIRLLCPNSKIGSIIGKGGSVIKKMREESGAKIKIGEQVPDFEECLVQISSSEYVDSYPSAGIQAALQVFRRLAELQMDKDKDNKSFVIRLLVPSSQIGCLLGKGGSIVSEMRKATKANIRISPKDEHSKCAEENDELVQIMGDQNVVQDAMTQVLNRLRNNLFKGHESQDASGGGGSGGGGMYGSSMLASSASLYAGANILGGYGGRLDSGSLGGMYPLANVGYYGMDYNYAGYGASALTGAAGLTSPSGLQASGLQASMARDTKESRRRQR